VGREMIMTFPGGKRVQAEYKGFKIMTDQPVYAGGEGSAPASFDLFLASIGTCAAYYVMAFCQKRGIPTDKVSVVLTTEKNPESRMIEKIFIEIRLPQDFPPRYKKAVIRSVHSCAVEAHILKAPSFEVKAVIEG